MMWTDDGIVLRLPEAADELPLADLIIDPDDIDELVMDALPQTSLFSARFRECAARALLLPRRRPDQRTPLWQQRQRAADLLAVASKYPTFPILLETSRECLQDVFDLPALREVLGQLRNRTVRVVSVDTAKASPFAQSLLFNWIAAYMYEGDAPLAERRAAALSLDRDLLRDLLGAEELRELLDPGALADIELELQLLADGRRARGADELHDVLRKVGDLDAGEVDLRCEGADGAAWLAELVHDRRAIEVSVAGVERFIAADDAARYRDALGCNVPLGLPRAFTEPVPHPLESLVARYARTHGPFVVEDLAGSLRHLGGAGDRALWSLSRPTTGWCAASSGPTASGSEWCDIDVLRQLRRRSLAALRREVEPVEPEAYARFLQAWHGVGSDRRGRRGAGRGARSAAGRSRWWPARWRPSCCPRVCAATDPPTSTSCALPATWCGWAPARWAPATVACGCSSPISCRCWRQRGSPSTRRRARCTMPSARISRCAAPASGAASARRAADATDAELLAALWDLVWGGEVTNDSLAPLRSMLSSKGVGAKGGVGQAGARSRPAPRSAHPHRPAARCRSLEPGGTAARSRRPSPTAGRAHHCAAVARALRRGHPRGRARRGRDRRLRQRVRRAEGVGGTRPGPPRLLRRPVSARRSSACPARSTGCGPPARCPTPSCTPSRRPAPVVLAATDPAQPYGAAISWPQSAGRPARSAGAAVVCAPACRWCGSTVARIIWSPFPLAERRHRLGRGVGRAGEGRPRPQRRGPQGERRAHLAELVVGAALAAAGFVEGYRGWVARS